MSHDDDAISNPSTGPSLDDVLLARYSRRQVLAGGLVAAGAALLGPRGAARAFRRRWPRSGYSASPAFPCRRRTR